jgi:hypothetical protein
MIATVCTLAMHIINAHFFMCRLFKQRRSPIAGNCGYGINKYELRDTQELLELTNMRSVKNPIPNLRGIGFFEPLGISKSHIP